MQLALYTFCHRTTGHWVTHEPIVMGHPFGHNPWWMNQQPTNEGLGQVIENLNNPITTHIYTHTDTHKCGLHSHAKNWFHISLTKIVDTLLNERKTIYIMSSINCANNRKVKNKENDWLFENNTFQALPIKKQHISSRNWGQYSMRVGPI